MFQGETAITIDDKGRLAIPTGYREAVARECGNRLVIAYNPFESGCLYLYPQHEWERVRDEVSKLPTTVRAHRQLQSIRYRPDERHWDLGDRSARCYVSVPAVPDVPMTRSNPLRAS